MGTVSVGVTVGVTGGVMVMVKLGAGCS